MAVLNTPVGYQGNFDPAVFLETYYSTINGNHEDGDFLRFCVDSLHSIFASGTIQGEKLLDIGTGPTVYSVISASRHVTEIHLSDLVDRNREVLQKWREGAPNVTALFEYIIQKENDGGTLERRVNALREKVTNIHRIDVLKSQLVDPSCTYDVITSSLCLEVAATSIEEYANIIAKIADMLSPGGHLVLVGVLGETFYRVGDFRFHALRVGCGDIQAILKRAGFEIKIWKENYNTPTDSREYSDPEGVFVMAAQKIKPVTAGVA